MIAHDSGVAVPSATVWCHDEPTAPLTRSVLEWRSVVIDAYAALPTLNVTRAQGMRLWGMDPSTCRSVLDSLVEDGMLVRTANGQYWRVDHVRADASLVDI